MLTTMGLSCRSLREGAVNEIAGLGKYICGHVVVCVFHRPKVWRLTMGVVCSNLIDSSTFAESRRRAIHESLSDIHLQGYRQDK